MKVYAYSCNFKTFKQGELQTRCLLLILSQLTYPALCHCYPKHYKNIRIKPQCPGGNPCQANYYQKQIILSLNTYLEGIFNSFSCHLCSLLGCSVKDEGANSFPNCQVKLLSLQYVLRKSKVQL